MVSRCLIALGLEDGSGISPTEYNILMQNVSHSTHKSTFSGPGLFEL